MGDFDIRCDQCGSEEVTISFENKGEILRFSCDKCPNTIAWPTTCPSCAEKESAKRELRQEGLHAGIHAPLSKGKVYFVSSSEESGPVKIGFTTSPDVEQRVSQFQAGYPGKLTVLATIEGGYPLETALHRIFSAHRIHSEWFERTPELSNLINALRSA